MKNSYLRALPWGLMLIFAACSSDSGMLSQEQVKQNDKGAISVIASQGDVDSKTDYAANGDNAFSAYWSATDAFDLYNSGSTDAITMTKQGADTNKKSATFKGVGTLASTFYCVYPSKSLTATDSKLTLDLSNQKGTSTGLNEVDYMYASGQSGTSYVSLKHKTAILHLHNITIGSSVATVKKILVNGTSVYSSASMSLTDGALSYTTLGAITATNDAGWTLSATGLLSDAYIAVFPNAGGTNNEITITAILSDNTLYSYAFTPSQVYSAGQMYKLSEKTMALGTFYIYNEYDLQKFRDMVNAGNSTLNAKLMRNIDMTNICSQTKGSWTPIGTYGGIFDGNNHTVSNLYIYDTNQAHSVQGLFGSISATSLISALLVDKATIYLPHGSMTLGGIAGSNNGGTIIGCSVTNSAITGSSTGVGSDAGSIIGSGSGYILGCMAYNNTINGYYAVGGLIGATSESGIINMVGCLTNTVAVTESSSYGSIGDIYGYDGGHTVVYACVSNNSYNKTGYYTNSKSSMISGSANTVDIVTTLNTYIKTWNNTNSDKCTYKFEYNSSMGATVPNIVTGKP